jgi:hypothetical protein
MTVAFAVVDFGFLIWQFQVITGLTREGANLASRDTTNLSSAAAAVLNDGAVLNLSKTGTVIITAVENIGTAAQSNFVITNQYVSSPTSGTAAKSQLGTYAGSPIAASLVTPPGATPVPQPGAFVFVAEIYNPFTPITPLGAFVSYSMPTRLYDVAYF